MPLPSASGASSGNPIGARVNAARLARTQLAAAMAMQEQEDDGGNWLANVLGKIDDPFRAVGRLTQEFGAGLTGLANLALPDSVFGVETPSLGVAPLGLTGGQELGGSGGMGLTDFLKGAASSAAGTATTAMDAIPGLGVVDSLTGNRVQNAILDAPADLWGEEFRAQDLQERIRERGPLSAIVEDVGNIALAGAAATAPLRAGSAAARAGSTAARLAGAEGTAARLGQTATSLAARRSAVAANPVVHALQHPYRTVAAGLREGLLQPAFARVNLQDAPAPDFAAADGVPMEALDPVDFLQRELPDLGVDWGSVRRGVDDQARDAAEYDTLPDVDPASAEAYDAFARETEAQYQRAIDELGMTFEFVDDAEPYATAAEALDDIRTNRHLRVAKTSDDAHPYLTPEQNDRFRAIHDLFGHAATGRGFDRHGEEAAYLAHGSMYSDAARPALASETRGQNAVLIESGDFGPQKAAVLSPEGTDIGPAVARFQAAPENPQAARPRAGDKLLATAERKLIARDARRNLALETRAADMSRSRASRSAAVTSAVSAARDLLLTKAQELGVEGVTRTTASQMIGDEINVRLNGVHQLIEGEFPGATPELLVKAGIRQTVIPEALRTPELAAALDDISALWEGERQAALAELTSNRVGTRGLDADPSEPVLTRRQEAMLSDARAKMRRATSDTTERRISRERRAREKLLTSLNDKIGRIGAQAARLDDIEAASLQRFDHSRRWTPRAWKSPEALAETAALVHERTLADGGASFNPHTGRFVEPGKDPGYAVAVVPGTARLVPVAEFTPQDVMDVARAFQEVYQHPNTVIGTWLDDEGMVHIDPSEIIGADPSLSRSEALAQAVVVGAVRGQEAIFDLAGSDSVDVHLKDRPDVAARFLDRNGRVTPHLRRAYGQILDAVTKAGMPADDAHRLVALEMTLATSAADKGSVTTPDAFFQRVRHEFAKKPSRISRALRQEIPNRRADTPAQRRKLWQEVERVVDDLDHALRWYHNSHDEIEARFRGFDDVILMDGTRINPADLMYQLLAASSVNASPRDNLGFAMQGTALVAREGLNPADFRAAMGALDDHVAGKITLEELAKRLGTKRAKTRRKVADNFLMGAVPKQVHGLPLARQMVLEILQGNLLARPDEAGAWQVAWTTEYLNDAKTRWGTKADLLDADALEAKMETARAKGKADVDATEARARLGDEQFAREVNSQAGRAKIISFWENLARPSDSLSVTLDRVMMETLGLQVPGSATISSPRWLTTADNLRSMAEELSAALGRRVMPHEVQAGLWVFGKAEISRVQRGHFLAWANDAGKLVGRGIQITDDVDPMLQWITESLAPYEGAGDTAARLPDDRDTLVRRERRIAEEVKDDDGVIRPGRSKKENITVDPGTTTKAKVRRQWRTREVKWLAERDAINQLLARGDKAAAQKQLSAYINRTLTQAPRSGGLLDDVGGGDFADLLDMTKQPAGMLKAVEALFSSGMDIGPWGGGLQQNFMGTVLGEFVPHSDVTGGVIRVLKGANFQTLVHENGHVLRQMLPAAEMRAMEAAYGVRDGRWSVEAEERFANDFLLHIASGTAPEGLGSVFARVRQTIAEVWHALRDTFFGRQVPEESRAVFDSWLSPERGAVDLPPSVALDGGVEVGTLGQRLANPPRLPEPPAGKRDFYGAGRSGQKALDDLTTVARRRKQLAATEAQVRKQIADVEAVLLEKRTPAELARTKLLEEAARLQGRVARESGRPTISNTPPAWQPLLDAVYRLEKEVAANPGLAEVFEGLPETLDQIQVRARELGFEPTHVRDFTRSQVNRLVFDSMKLGVTPLTEEVSGTRRQRTGALTRAGVVDRSIESLLAATVEAVRETRTNAVIDWVEKNASRKIPQGAQIPDGWQLWDPTRTYLLTGTELSPNAQQLLPTAARDSTIVPKEVVDVVYRMSKNHDHRALRAIAKVTNPWRTLVLTLSPGWYVRNFAGNVMMAAMNDTVRLRDWQAAWRSYRSKDAVGRFSDIPFVESGSLARDAGLMADDSLIPSAGVREFIGEGEGLLGRDSKGAHAYQAVIRKLTRANEVVDEFARAAVYHKNLNTLNMSETAAWDAANKAMVDYQALSPFERSVVRAVIPFYSWQKGILKVTMDLVIDHPARVGLLMQLGQMQNEYVADRLGLEVEDVPEQYRHLVGDRNLRSYNPFADSASLLTPEGIAASINPLIEIGLRDGLGAPEFVGRDTPMRLSPFGTAVPDVNEGEELLNLITRSPFGRILGAEGAGDTLGTALGLRPVDDAMLADRFQRARTRIEGEPATSGGGFRTFTR